jgi:hypothetical protein
MTMTTKTKKADTVAECTATLTALETKRAALLERGTRLPEMRRDVAYAAHVEDNAAARKELDRVADEVSKHRSEVDSINDAISEATDKLHIAQQVEAATTQRAKAKEALEVAAAFRKAGAELDAALKVAADKSAALMTLLSALHRATGTQLPSPAQVDLLSTKALETFIRRTPWGKNFRPIPPGERREFAPLIDGWATVVENRLRTVLDKEAA